MFKKGCTESNAGERRYESLATVQDIPLIFIDQRKELCGKESSGIASVLVETEGQPVLAGETIDIK